MYVVALGVYMLIFHNSICDSLDSPEKKKKTLGGIHRRELFQFF